MYKYKYKYRRQEGGGSTRKNSQTLWRRWFGSPSSLIRNCPPPYDHRRALGTVLL